MTQSGVSAFARIARGWATAAVLLAGSAGALWAQGTGKIEGRVRDQAGAPIQNAQVIIPGTAFSALTNAQGYYFINNVPVSTISLRASFIGYKRTEVAGLKVLAGQTMTQDIQLESSPVVVEDITIVGADQPLVPRDQVTTKHIIDGDFSEALPADRVNNVLLLQPGVVANSSGSSLSIRGGRTDEAVTIIDGVPVQPGNRGTGFAVSGSSGVSVGTNAFEEISVTTGAAGAEFGNAQSGVINIATRTGGAAFAGRLSVESDEMFGKINGLGFNRVEGNLSGPLMGGLTFALNGALEGQKSAASGKGREELPVFVNSGTETFTRDVNGTADIVDNVTTFEQYTGDCDGCNGAWTPFSNSSVYQVGGNLNYSYGSGSRLRLSSQLSQNQGRTFSFLSSQNLADQAFGFRNESQVFTLGWTQNLSKSAERAFAIDLALSYQRDKFVNSPVDAGGAGTGTLGFYLKKMPLRYDFDNFPLDDARLDCFVTNDKTCIGPFDYNQGNEQFEFTSDSRRNGWAVSTRVRDAGGPGDLRMSLNDEKRKIARGNIDWQFDRYNRLKFGGEFTEYDITAFSVAMLSQPFGDYIKEKPQRLGVFLEDRLDLGDVVVQGGLRYDWYDTRASRPFFDGVDTLNNAAGYFPRVSTDPRLPLGDRDPRDNPGLWQRDQSHDYISPRIQVAFPVTERTNFRLSYAHAVQAPDFSVLLNGINTDLTTTNTNHVYGADLDFGKTITFEFGIRHAFNDDMVLDVAAYNRDNLSNVAGRYVFLRDPVSGNVIRFQQFTNQDFGTTRGIDLRLDRRFGSLFNGTLAYSFTDAKSTGSNPFTYLAGAARVVNRVSTLGNQLPAQAIAPVGLSRPHNLTAALALTFPNGWRDGTTVGSIFQNFNVFASMRLASGTAYSACIQPGNETVLANGNCGGNGAEAINGERLPSFKQLDMRFLKGFKLGGNDLSVYLDARNILNFTNVLNLFVATNDTEGPDLRTQRNTTDTTNFRREAAANPGALQTNGDIDLTNVLCSSWVRADGLAAAANCAYMVGAEARFGNGDGILSAEEQLRLSNSVYESAGNGGFGFNGPGRQLRLGVEFNF